MEKIKKVLREHGKYFSGCYIAGGAVRSLVTGQEIKDIDVYPKNEESYFKAIQYLVEDGAFIVHHSSKAVSFMLDDMVYQIINMGYTPKPQDIYDKFDFTSCMAAYDVDLDVIDMHPDFMLDCASRRLVFNPNTLHPYHTLMIRLPKFKSRGWHISNQDTFKIAHACPKINSWEELKIQLGGFYGTYIELEIEDKGEFSEESMYEVLNSLRDRDKGVDPIQTSTVEVWELFAEKGLGEFTTKEGASYLSVEAPYISYSCEEYGITHEYVYSETKDKYPNVKTVDALEAMRGKVYYKVVRYNPETRVCTSWKKKDFVYKVGSYAVANNNHGLYVCTTLAHARDKVRSYKLDLILKVVVDPADFIADSGPTEFRVQKMLPIGVQEFATDTPK